MDDYDILGVPRGSGPAAIKKAFRKRTKELHPDLSADNEALERHILFIEVCDAYRRLSRRGARGDGEAPAAPMPSAAPASPPAPTPGVAGGKAMVRHADPAYAFYKNGIKYFSMIHPSHWNVDTDRVLNTRIAGRDEDQAIIRNRIVELVKLFPRAYYYFGIVAHEYPDSPWAFDAGEKMRQIEGRTRMYAKIIESFSSWNRDGGEIRKRYKALYDKHEETKRGIGDEERKRWHS
jgi:curved DNA-binding protein CbpA